MNLLRVVTIGSLLAAGACSEKEPRLEPVPFDGSWVLSELRRGEGEYHQQNFVADKQGFLALKDDNGYPIESAQTLDIFGSLVSKKDYEAYYERALDLKEEKSRANIPGTKEYCLEESILRREGEFHFLNRIKNEDHCGHFNSSLTIYNVVNRNGRLTLTGRKKGRKEVRIYKRLENRSELVKTTRKRSLLHGVHKYINRGGPFLDNGYYHIPMNYDGSLCDSGVHKLGTMKASAYCAQLANDQANNHCGSEIRKLALKTYCSKSVGASQ